ncbi:Carboxypeptidase [Psidium guajava]|nr:Carboxypeptidase [Psidium guajava]
MPFFAATNSIDDAASARITALPGQPMEASVSQYSGYVRISEKKKMFYWLVEASSYADSKPLLLWLNGGPGCSSIGWGAFQEIGPFQVLPNGELAKREISWDTAMDNYAFLNKWLEVFPKFKYRDFYLAGESYAGHYVPQLAQVIVNRNKGIARPIINLKGLMVGNPVLDSRSGDPGRWEFYWIHGLISDTTYENMKKFCSVDRASEGCFKAWNESSHHETGVINPFNVYTRPCEDNSVQDLLYRDGNGFCLEAGTQKYLKRKDVQERFHVDTAFIPLNYTLCSEPQIKLRYRRSDREASVLPVLKELMDSRLQIWIYSGTADAAVPLPMTRRNIAALKLKVKEKWYPWYHHNLLAGWIEIYEGLTFVALMGSGHEVPMYRPSQALTMFQSFLSNAPMPKPPPAKSRSA